MVTRNEDYDVKLLLLFGQETIKLMEETLWLSVSNPVLVGYFEPKETNGNGNFLFQLLKKV
ncbi:hypothetical protein DGG96_18090 [Legionella qingyii]|uniref:Uncharacterized protein n=1 Tax=Legionella qingyii TaxID=2184757 RepID=A0A317U0H5_9GAMM|nr:hypothetical protein DGG96_18090 [Legionella qingyii]